MKTEIPEYFTPENYSRMYRDVVLDPNKLHPEPVISSDPASPSARIEFIYQANKIRWNTLPPLSPRSIADAILKAIQDTSITPKIEACLQANTDRWNQHPLGPRLVIDAFLHAIASRVKQKDEPAPVE